MSVKRAKINPYRVLGITDERADKMSEELKKLESESQYSDEVLAALAERYDPESLVMGMYLGLLLMKNEGRLLPPNAKIVDVLPLPAIPAYSDPAQN